MSMRELTIRESEDVSGGFFFGAPSVTGLSVTGVSANIQGPDLFGLGTAVTGVAFAVASLFRP